MSEPTIVHELKPCPFCGSVDLGISHPEIESYFVSCYECDAESSDIGETAAAAAQHWNRRSVDRAALVELHSDLSEDLAELARIESEASVPSAPDVRVTVSRVVVRLAAALGLDS